MRVVWREQGALIPCGGHGVNFTASDDRPTPDNLLAMIEGFDWLHDPPETVEVFIRPADSRYTAAFLTQVRPVIERFLSEPWEFTDRKDAGKGWASPEVYVSMNC